jgi:hypothetical protein
MANGESAMGTLVQSVVRRWLEVLLPLYTAGLLLVWFQAEYTPTVLTESVSDSPWPGLAWAVVGALGGILALWALIVGFFLLYSPFYLFGKLPLLMGQGGWVDRREIRFYLACFAMLCLLATLSYWEPPIGLTLFAMSAGCGPVFWRLLV